MSSGRHSRHWFRGGFAARSGSALVVTDPSSFPCMKRTFAAALEVFEQEDIDSIAIAFINAWANPSMSSELPNSPGHSGSKES